MTHDRTEYFMRFKLPADMGVTGFKEGAAAFSSDDYVAYRAGTERRLRLKICPTLQYWRRLEYSKLMEIGEDGLAEAELLLGFPTAVIVIKGQNLKVIADEIAEERCELIQAFDEKRWRRPADTKAPFIGNIGILAVLPEGSMAGKKIDGGAEKQTTN